MRKYIILFLLIFCVFPSTIHAQEIERKAPVVTITNVTSTSFTVTWFSHESADQAVLYGVQEPLDKWAVDDRGLGVQRGSHHVTLTGLAPSTEYFFRINNQGVTYKQTTPANLTEVTPLPLLFRGNILNEDGVIPEEAIIYMRLDGSGLVSTFSLVDGSYRLRASGTRNRDLTQFYKFSETDFVHFFVRSGFEGETAKTIFAYARGNPLNFNLQIPRIPFYKIQLPGLEIYEASIASVPVDPASPPLEPVVEPASDEGFFGVVWKRIRDIF